MAYFRKLIACILLFCIVVCIASLVSTHIFGALSVVQRQPPPVKADPLPLNNSCLKMTTKPGKCKLPKGIKWRPEGNRSSAPARKLLQEGKPFCWLRWADGEIIAATGCDIDGRTIGYANHTTTWRSLMTQLREDLFDYGSLHSSSLFVSLGYFYLCDGRGEGYMWEPFNALLNGPQETRSFNPSFQGFSNEFYLPLVPNGKKERQRPRNSTVPILSNSTVVLVGPPHLSKLRLLLGYKAWIKVPQGLCWKDRKRLLGRMRNQSMQYPSSNVVFLMTCGPAAKPILYKAFRELGHKDSFIDIGKSLDGFAGKTKEKQQVRQLCKKYSDIMPPDVC